MKTEIVLVPNPNQLILLREVQKSVCAVLGEFSPVPILPICVRCEKLRDVGDKITKAEVGEIEASENSVFLSVALTINGKKCNGKIELCIIFSEKIFKSKAKKTEIQKRCGELLSKIKKISPFRIVELAREEFENGNLWRVLREKWEKLKTP